MRAEKLHGCENDFLLFDLLTPATAARQDAIAARAGALCHRHRGVGADGLLLLVPGEEARWRMRIINADGSEPETCGNGIRCLVHHLARVHGLRGEVELETGAGLAVCSIVESGGARGSIRVDMGVPEVGPMVELAVPGLPALMGRAVSMGNPHLVVLDPPLLHTGPELALLGPPAQSHAHFPEGVNLELAWSEEVDAYGVRVWERGVGETRACGTGACAVAVAAHRPGGSSRRTIRLPGGALQIDWAGPGERLFMTGPAEYVFTVELSDV